MMTIADQVKELCDEFMARATTIGCARCAGTGRRKAYVCIVCKGTGRIWNLAHDNAETLKNYFETYYKPAIGTKREADETRNIVMMMASLRKPSKQRVS